MKTINFVLAIVFAVVAAGCARDSWSGPSSIVTVDLKVNGQNGAVQASGPFRLTWVSEFARNCEISSLFGTAPVETRNSAGLLIAPGHAWYPARGREIIFTLSCNRNGRDWVRDSITVAV